MKAIPGADDMPHIREPIEAALSENGPLLLLATIGPKPVAALSMATTGFACSILESCPWRASRLGSLELRGVHPRVGKIVVLVRSKDHDRAADCFDLFLFGHALQTNAAGTRVRAEAFPDPVTSPTGLN